MSSFLKAPPITAANLKAKLRTLMRNPSRSIDHVHIFGSFENIDAVCGYVSQIASENNKNGSSTKVLRVNCSYVDGNQRTFLNCLREELHLSSKIDSISDLCTSISEFLDEDSFKRLFILLEDADSLMKLPHNFLNGFFSIEKQVRGCVRIMTVGEQSWTQLSTTERISKPLSVYVGAYDRDTCIDSIKKTLRQEQIHDRFTALVVESAYLHCRDHNKLLEIIRTAWKNYEDEEGDRENINLQNSKRILQEVIRDDVLNRLGGKDQGETFVLPLSTSAKFLMIAAYCAGNNAPTSDKRYFTKHHGKEKRSEAREKHASLVADQKEVGPRTFDLQRLTFIYKSLLTSQYHAMTSSLPIVDLNSQVATLAVMGLLSRASSVANLDQPKFKCMISFENANSIARSFIELNNGEGLMLKDFLDQH